MHTNDQCLSNANNSSKHVQNELSVMSFYKVLRVLGRLKRLLVIFSMLLSSVVISAQAATVSVSNYPLFLLSQAVTEGAPSAKQLLQAGEVGHHGSISPGDIKAIQDSKFVVWFGEPLEHTLASSLNTAPNAIALFKFDAFNRHALRDVTGNPIANTLDPHIWLDPENAKAITRALAVIHSHANPQYKTLYHTNAQKFAQRMNKVVAIHNPQTTSQKQKARPYWAYHDAYQYIENSLNLQLIGSLSTDDHLAPKASQLRRLNEQRPAKKMCLVSPSPPAKGLLAKLQPVDTTVQAEDMSASKNFVSGWNDMAQQIKNCIS